MLTNKEEKRCIKAILTIEDVVKDIDQKLSHIIEYKKKEFYFVNGNGYWKKAYNGNGIYKREK